MVRVEAQKAMVSGSKINIEHRIIRPDGHLRYVHDQAEIILSDTGVPLRVLGTVQDVTERKLAEEALGIVKDGIACWRITWWHSSGLLMNT